MQENLFEWITQFNFKLRLKAAKGRKNFFTPLISIYAFLTLMCFHMRLMDLMVGILSRYSCALFLILSPIVKIAFYCEFLQLHYSLPAQHFDKLH